MIIRLTSTQVGRLALKQRLDRYPVAINSIAINSLRANPLSTDADLNSMQHLAVEHPTSPESWRGSEQLSSKGVPTTCQTVHLPSFSGIHTRSAARFVLSCTYSSATAAACISSTLTKGNLLTRSGRATLSNATNNCYFVIGISPKGADRKFAQLSRGLFPRILCPTLDNAERSKHSSMSREVLSALSITHVLKHKDGSEKGFTTTPSGSKPGAVGCVRMATPACSDTRSAACCGAMAS